MRKSSKEFLGVLLSVLVCVFIVGLVVYATTTIGDDITVGGNDLTFANGAALSNQDADWLTITETNASVSGDFGIWGNDLKFANGAAISNAAAADGLLITEDLVSIVGKASVSGAFYAGGTATFGGVASVTSDLWVDRIYGTKSPGYLSVGDAAATSHALVSEDDLLVTGKLEVDGIAYFDSSVSVSSSGILVDGGATIVAGIASPSAACVKGSLYIDTLLGVISICDGSGFWSPITSQ